jgi:hypothetical protein
MTIDQRNAGASVTPTTDQQYTLDRWNCPLTQASKFSVQQNAGAVTPPTSFSNYLGCTSLSAYTVGAGDVFNIAQNIEGFNTADLGWGTANAKTVTLSFWVRSSLTGTFAGVIKNSASSYSYPFTYTISSANTWEYETITIAGPTAGTWIGATNGVGVRVLFTLGCGSTYIGTAGAWAAANYYGATGNTNVVSTNAATFYVTGVQLEVGSQATSFDFRDYGRELILCQRYFQLAPTTQGASSAVDQTQFLCAVPLWTPMRTSPTSTLISGSVVHKPGIAFITISSVDSGPSATGGSYTTFTIPSGYGTQFTGQAISPIKLSAEL